MKFYDEERARWPMEFAIIVEHPEHWIAYLSRYYGLHERIDFRTKRAGSCWSEALWNGRGTRNRRLFGAGYEIAMCPRPTWGELAHEFAHILDVEWGRDSRHDKRLTVVLGLVLNVISKYDLIERDQCLK